MFNQIKKNKLGFTLIEVLVTVAVFVITMTVSSSIFINVNNLQQQTANMAKLQNEGRYVMEKMSKEIRGRELDYDAMNTAINNTTGETDTLIFKPDEFGEIYEIFFDLASNSIKIKINNSDQGVELNSSEITVEKMQFIITPISDPYADSADITLAAQPRVTIMIVIKNKNVPEKYQKTLHLQTTISSKIYR